MSRFNVRSITEIPAVPVIVPKDKQPSAYDAMRRSTAKATPPPMLSPTTGNVVIDPTKKGRPTKDDVRRQKMDMASAAISALVGDKPTKAKIRDYMAARIAQLNLEKR
jgi:hypothetical protein